MDNPTFLAPDACWYNAPRERTPQFFQTYSQVSIALQAALRDLAPAHFFADVSRFEDPQMAWPLLVYASSPVFHPKVRTEFNWDVLHESSMKSFYRQARRDLPAQLELVRRRLSAEGRTDLLPHYRIDHASEIIETLRTQRGLRKLLQRPVVGEGRLLNELTRFSNLAEAAPRVRVRVTAEFAKNWTAILSRFYGSHDFSVLEPVLLDAVTRTFLEVKPVVVETEAGGGEHLAA